MLGYSTKVIIENEIENGLITSSSPVPARSLRAGTDGIDYVSFIIHFEITGDPCKLIGTRQGDLFTNRTVFCS